MNIILACVFSIAGDHVVSRVSINISEQTVLDLISNDIKRNSLCFKYFQKNTSNSWLENPKETN